MWQLGEDPGGSYYQDLGLKQNKGAVYITAVRLCSNG